MRVSEFKIFAELFKDFNTEREKPWVIVDYSLGTVSVEALKGIFRENAEIIAVRQREYADITQSLQSMSKVRVVSELTHADIIGLDIDIVMIYMGSYIAIANDSSTSSVYHDMFNLYAHRSKYLAIVESSFIPFGSPSSEPVGGWMHINHITGPCVSDSGNHFTYQGVLLQSSRLIT